MRLIILLESSAAWDGQNLSKTQIYDIFRINFFESLPLLGAKVRLKYFPKINMHIIFLFTVTDFPVPA